MEGDRFCTRCGAELPDGAQFCAECGAQVGGGGNLNQPYGSPYDYRERGRTGPGFSFVILFYGIFAIVLGLMDLVSGLGMNEAAYNDLIDSMSSMTGMDASTMVPAWTDSIPMLMSVSMGCLIVSGALAVVCYSLCKKAENWKAAVIVCAAASVACLGICSFSVYTYLGIPLFVIGLLITAMLYMRRDTFKA